MRGVGGGAGPRVGIFLGAASARAALVGPARRGRPPRVIAEAEAPVDPEAWTGAPERIGATLARLARDLPAAARRADRPVAIALPDPLATEDRLVFRDLPASPREVAELVRFRVARDHRRDASGLACAAQLLGPCEGGTEVVVRILPQALVSAVEEGAHRAGFVPWRLDTFAGFALDEAARRAGRGAGGWLWSDGAWWALMCWRRDEGCPDAGPESHLHAEWRRAGDEAALADKAVRIAKSFALRSGLDRLALTLDLAGAAGTAVAARLDADPVVSAAPASAGRRLPDPALCVALP